MTPPPAARPASQEAHEGQPRSSRNPRWVRITNPAMNQSPVIRRKDANCLVAQGRAEWVAADQLRLNLSHYANRANVAAAAYYYNRAVAKLVRSIAELRHIPVVRPEIALTNISVPAQRHFAGRSGPVRQIAAPATKE